MSDDIRDMIASRQSRWANMNVSGTSIAKDRSAVDRARNQMARHNLDVMYETPSPPRYTKDYQVTDEYKEYDRKLDDALAQKENVTEDLHNNQSNQRITFTNPDAGKDNEIDLENAAASKMNLKEAAGIPDAEAIQSGAEEAARDKENEADDLEMEMFASGELDDNEEAAVEHLDNMYAQADKIRDMIDQRRKILGQE